MSNKVKTAKSANTATKVMCNLVRQFGTDAEKEVKGVRFYIDKEHDIWILISRFVMRNSELQKQYAQLAVKFGDDTKSAEYIRAANEAFIRSCVRGWNNICDNDGEEIEFSIDKAIEILMQTPDLLEVLYKFALDDDNYRLDEAIKN